MNALITSRETQGDFFIHSGDYVGPQDERVLVLIAANDNGNYVAITRDGAIDMALGNVDDKRTVDLAISSGKLKAEYRNGGVTLHPDLLGHKNAIRTNMWDSSFIDNPDVLNKVIDNSVAKAEEPLARDYHRSQLRAGAARQALAHVQSLPPRS